MRYKEIVEMSINTLMLLSFLSVSGANNCGIVIRWDMNVIDR